MRRGKLLMEIKAARGANQNIQDGDDPKVLTRTDLEPDEGDHTKLTRTIAATALPHVASPELHTSHGA